MCKLTSLCHLVITVIQKIILHMCVYNKIGAAIEILYSVNKAMHILNVKGFYK